jgi:hypothetical protein
MSAPGRWLRLDVTAFDSEWLAGLAPEAQHAWTRLLLHVKAVGSRGQAKRLGPVAVKRLWGIAAPSLQRMEAAAVGDGALLIDDGMWTVTGWERYQKPDGTNPLRQKSFRSRSITPHNGVMVPVPAVIRHATETETKTKTKKKLPPPTDTPPLARASPSLDEEWERVRSCYPRRQGDQRWRDARRSWGLRIREGVPPAELLAGVERYRKFLQVQDRIGSEFVKQAATFFGKNEAWREEWAVGNGNKPAGKIYQRLRSSCD